MNQFSLTAEYNAEPDRVTTFFRLILAIPQVIVLYLLQIAVIFTVFISWFALVFTGRYPETLYNFHTGFLRYSIRVNGYCLLLTDKYPPFSISTDDYPVTIQVARQLPQYDQVKVFFRLILAIPALIMAAIIGQISGATVIASWLMIIFRGRHPRTLHNIQVYTQSYGLRVNAYVMLLSEAYPSIDSEEDAAQSGLPSMAS